MEVFVDRLLAPHLRDALTDARIVAVLGPRQAGKSTLVRHIALEAGMMYTTLDDETILRRARDDPAGFLADRPGTLVIDEIQRAPGLMLALKRDVDLDPRPGRFMITGSANLVAMAAIPDALPGRVDYFRLWPLTQRELSRGHVDVLQQLIDNDPPSITDAATGRRAYADRIAAGGYPDAIARTPRRRARLLGGLVTSTLTRDMQDLWSGAAEITERTLRHLAVRSGDLLNYASLGRDIGVSGTSLKAHVRALEQLFLVRRHPAWSANLDQRLVKMPKAYVADTGMLCQLLGADSPAIVERDDLAGRAFESFVANELVRLADAAGRIDVRFFHYRDSHQREIDIIIELSGGDIVAIEVKASATVDSRDFATMRLLRAAIGDRFRSGVVMFAGDRSHRFDANLHAVPISALWTDG